MPDKVDGNIKGIVRIANRDLNGNLPPARALTRIKGVGVRMSNAAVAVLGRQTDVPDKLGAMSDQQIKTLERIIRNPSEFNLPNWLVNRRKDFTTGEDTHLLESELIFTRREDIKRMQKVGARRGIRLALGLKVRGQRTRSTGRKGKTVGVQKKKQKPAAKK